MIWDSLMPKIARATRSVGVLLLALAADGTVECLGAPGQTSTPA